MTHTKGDHCPQDWSATAGSWWSEPCFCKAIQPLNTMFSATAATGQGTMQFYPTTANAAAANNAVVNWTITGYSDGTTWWPSQPIWIQYDHHCAHEETVKVLTDLVKHLVDTITAEKAEIGTAKTRPVKETKKEET